MFLSDQTGSIFPDLEKASFRIIRQTAHAEHSCKAGWELSWFTWSTLICQPKSHSWAVTEKNIPGKLTETQRIQPVYPNEILMLWQLEGNLPCRQNRAAAIHQCGHRRVHHYWDVRLSKLPFLPVLNFGNKLCPTVTTYPHFQPLSNVTTMDDGLFSPARCAVVHPVASFCTYPFFIRHLCVL